MPRIVIDGVAREVSLERVADGYTATVDGRRYAVSSVVASGAALAFLVDRDAHVAYVSAAATGMQLSIAGNTHTIARGTPDADRPVSAAHAGDGRLEAPMPGVILAVNVASGDTVRAGQAMVVLESMKMHNEITAPADGVVRKVNCRVGEQVPYGHVLVEIGTA